MILITFYLSDLVTENNPICDIDVFVNYLDLKEPMFNKFSSINKGKQLYNIDGLFLMNRLMFLSGEILVEYEGFYHASEHMLT